MVKTAFERGLPSDPVLQPIAREFLEGLMAEMPFLATDLGIHQWDHEMPDLSPTRRKKWLDLLHQVQSQLADIEVSRLSAEDRADWVMLSNQVELALRDETDWNVTKKDPNWYNAVISESLMSLSRRSFGQTHVRAQHLVQRLRKAPQLLASARQLLDNPPLVFVEMAIEQFPLAVPMIRGLASAFSSIDADTAKDLEASSGELISAYEEFVRYLKQRWLPNAHGDYRLGEKRYQERLRWQEGVEQSLPELLERGYQELNRLRTLFAATTTEIDPMASASEVLARMAADVPSRDQVLGSVAKLVDELKHFVHGHHLLTLAENQPPLIVETPAYLRMTTLASISPVGPFEEEAKESYFQVTVPEEDSSPSQLSEFNPWTLAIIAAHEVYPGHYAQFLRLAEAKSTVRKILWSGAFVEGWAHYCEEMLIEAGYGQGHLMMRLAQIQEGLVRVGRFIVGIRLHTQDMTIDQAQEFFQETCMMGPDSARREALRGTSDPFYLIYTLGKLDILSLRQSQEQRLGEAFNLQTFHDQLLAHGAPTLAVLGELLQDAAEGDRP